MGTDFKTFLQHTLSLTSISHELCDVLSPLYRRGNQGSEQVACLSSLLVNELLWDLNSACGTPETVSRVSRAKALAKLPLGQPQGNPREFLGLGAHLPPSAASRGSIPLAPVPDPPRAGSSRSRGILYGSLLLCAHPSWRFWASMGKCPGAIHQGLPPPHPSLRGLLTLEPAPRAPADLFLMDT